MDPLAGSYLIEYLTDEIEHQAEGYIQKIDDMGGAMAAIERGYIQDEIHEAAYQYQQAVERVAKKSWWAPTHSRFKSRWNWSV